MNGGANMNISVNQFRKILFYITFFLYVIYRILAHTVFHYDHANFYNLYSYVMLILIVGSFAMFFIDNFSSDVKELFVYAVLASVFLLVAYVAQYRTLIFVMMLVISSKDMSFKTICKILVAALITVTLSVFLMTFMGMTEDVVYLREVTSRGAKRLVEAHSYGFTYYSYPSFILLTIMLCWGYLRDKSAKWFEYILWFIVQYISYTHFTDRLAYYIGVVYLIILFIHFKINVNSQASSIVQKICYVVGALGFTVCLILTYRFVMDFGASKAYAYDLNEGLNGRLDLSYKAFREYGIPWLGQNITMVGNYQIKTGASNDYFFIDSGYIYSLVCYGKIFTLVLLGFYTYLSIMMVYKKKYTLFFWLLVVMIFSVVNDVLISFEYNPLLMLIPNVVVYGLSENEEYQEKEEYEFALEESIELY